MKEKEEINIIIQEYSDKIKELYSKYPHIEGILDGGPPKKEQDNIKKEMMIKIQKIKEKYTKK